MQNELNNARKSQLMIGSYLWLPGTQCKSRNEILDGRGRMFNFPVELNVYFSSSGTYFFHEYFDFLRRL